MAGTKCRGDITLALCPLTIFLAGAHSHPCALLGL